MKNLILFLKKIWTFWLGLVISLSLLWPLFAAPYFTHHDDVQLIRIYEMDKCVRDFQIPCRWVPDLGGEYGYPIFNYYAPLPYYIGEIFYFTTNNLIFSAKMIFGISFVGAFIFMYLCARKLWGEEGGLISGVFFELAPYHAVDFYVRGAMGELWALMFFPAIFWSLFRLREKPNLTNFILLSLFFSLLIVSHNLSAMIFLPPVLISILVFFILDKGKKFLGLSLLSISFAMLLSSFYMLPALIEKPLVHLETTIEGYFSYTEHFKGLRRLFLERDWGYGPSLREVPGVKDGLSFQIGIIHVLGWLMSLVIALTLWKKDKKKALLICLFSIFILGSIFMIHPRSEFIWKRIQPLEYLQFPWRFMEIIIFFVALLSGSIASAKFKKLTVPSLILVVLLNFSYFKPSQFLNVTDKVILTGGIWDKQIKRSIFDYLPIYAEHPPVELATDRYKILTGDTKILNYNQGSNWFKFTTQTKTHSIIRMSQYFFPNWVILMDNKKIIIDYKNDLGLMTFILGVGDHDIYGKLQDTPIRSIANILSLLSLLSLSGLSLLKIKKINRFFSYYLRVLKT